MIFSDYDMDGHKKADFRVENRVSMCVYECVWAWVCVCVCVDMNAVSLCNSLLSLVQTLMWIFYLGTLQNRAGL